MPTFQAETAITDARTEILLAGEIDIEVAPRLTDLGMSSLADPSTEVLVVNMTDVTFIDSTGIGVLIRIRNLAQELNKRLLVSGVSTPVQRLFDLTGLDTVFLRDDALGTCAETDDRNIRCELIAAHDGPHAAATGGGYQTWLAADVSRWSIESPPGWLIDLLWAPGYQPTHEVPPTLPL